ncbi:MAG: DUF6291 domain-containing protein [Bacteroidaceae bacterium]
MNEPSFTIYGFQYNAIEYFTLEQKGKLLDAFYSFVINETRPVFDDKEVELAFDFMRLEELKNL